MANDSTRRYVIISSDEHAGADLMDYKPYLEASLHDDFEEWARDFREPWSDFDVEMMDTDDPFLRVGATSFLAPYNWDNERRLAHLDAEGIAAEVLFPNTVPPFYPSSVITAPSPTSQEEYRLRWAGVQAHNRWLVDFCAAAPGRRAGLAQVFLYDLDDALAEVRWAKESGLAGVLIPSDHHDQLEHLYERRLDPFWAACAELDMSVNRHSVMVGPPETPETGPGGIAAASYENMWFAHRGLGHLILGGVFKRHPDLKFVFTESGCAWVPAELEGMEKFCRSGKIKGTPTYAFSHRAVEDLELSPTEYYQRNCFLGASLMLQKDVDARHQLGVDHIMWGADYPHHEGTWPYTKLALRVNFADVPEEEVRAMTSVNAARIYGFDLEFLQGIADKIGPTPSEIAMPVSADELPGNSFCRTLADAAEVRV